MATTRKQPPHTLVIDIGGTGIKMITTDGEARPLTERARMLTPQTATPEAVLEVIRELIAGQPGSHARVSVGFPGVVRHGVVHTAPNLSTDDWRGFDLATALTDLTGHPTRAINDAELQGLGVIDGKGVEMVLTLGTGLGTGLYTDGVLVPNLELAHHPFEKRQTYEERVGNAERERVGNSKWRHRVLRALVIIDHVFNPDLIHLGGGNARKLDPEMLPADVRLFDNVEGLSGGVRLWQGVAGTAS